MKDEKRNKVIKARVSEEEKKLIKEKAKYYGYRNISNYIRDAVIYEKVTQVNVIGRKEIYDAFSENTRVLKDIAKGVRHLCKYVTQVNEFEIRQLSNSIRRNMINQTDIRVLIGKKLKYNSWQKINRNKQKNKNASELYRNLNKF